MIASTLKSIVEQTKNSHIVAFGRAAGKEHIRAVYG